MSAAPRLDPVIQPEEPELAEGRALRLRRVTLQDVASCSGVSCAVASRALSGHRSVAPRTRERVRRVAREMGYRASAVARALVARTPAARSMAPLRCAVLGLGLSADVLGSTFYGQVLAGLASHASEEYVDIHLVVVGAEVSAQVEGVRRLVAEDRADGLILMTTFPLSPADVQPLEDAGVPYVLVNRHFGERPVNCVTVAWEEAAQDTVRRLAELGHRSMALLLPTEEHTSVTGRADGWHEGVRRMGLDPRQAPVVRYPGTSRGPHDALTQGQAVARRLLQEGLPDADCFPTAIVGFNDWCSLGVLRAAAEAGLRVPDQLSVIGFDNSLVATLASPPLSSYGPHFVELGQQAVGLLAGAVRGEIAQRRRVVVPVDFVSRESCGPAPALR